MKALVLDSEAISVVARTHAAARPGVVVAALRAALEERAPVVVPSAVLAEQYRGGRYDALLDACRARYPAIEVAPTDKAMAKRVGNLLARKGKGAEDHVDATVIATAITAGGGLGLTSDPGDLESLADGLVGITIKAV